MGQSVGCQYSHKWAHVREGISTTSRIPQIRLATRCRNLVGFPPNLTSYPGLPKTTIPPLQRQPHFEDGIGLVHEHTAIDIGNGPRKDGLSEGHMQYIVDQADEIGLARM